SRNKAIVKRIFRFIHLWRLCHKKAQKSQKFFYVSFAPFCGLTNFVLQNSLMPDRAEAWELLCEYTKGDSLRKHALAVEAAMRASSKKYGSADADEDEWGIVGLLHDFDYEMFPSADQHPFTGSNILCGRGYPDRIIRAILGHATYTGVPRDTDM